MFRKLPSFVFLAWLVSASLEIAIAQWPNDEQLFRLPSARTLATTKAPRIAQAAVVETPELPAPEELVELEELSLAGESDSWVLPTYWFNAVEWEGGAEVGINGTAGNSETASFRAGVNLKRKTEINETKFDLTYLKTTADGTETQHNAIQNFGYERLFGGSRWSLFTKEYLAYDEFKAFDLRLALNAGVGYKLIDTETTKLKGRYGAGVSHEFGGPSDEWVAEIVYGAEFERRLTERQKLALTVDYFPEWGNFDNYRMVTDLGWEVLLDEAHHLNLKLSVNDRYDSTPNGRKPNDINYALLLLWKI